MRITSSNFLLLLLLAFCFASFAFGATTLPPDEVQALRDIGKTLGKKEWNFHINPCSEQASTWVTPNAVAGSENNVSCNCSIANDDFCHVVSIVLKSQNLQGHLPPELINLPYLQEIDLALNYLNGTIPKEWGSLNLVYISIYGNRISGPIPMELANIVTLKKLDLMFNQMSGNISHLGSLSNLENLLLCSNNFTGELPETLSRLTKLQQVLLSDNQFSGKIPKFIQRWTNLNNLALQGSGLSGPIPSEISSLRNLTYLIISDLNGPDSTFPQVNNMTRLNTLILRNCNINDTIPPYLKNLPELKDIDISFNKLSGEMQTDFEGPSFEQMYLTKNFLTGPVPNWTTRPTKVKLDLSYNNFNIENSELEDCQKGNMNLFASFPRKNSGPIACVKSNACTQMITSLYINCGGESITIGDKMYEQDESDSGPATFSKPSNNWAFSNTGHFLDATANNYKAKNKTTLHMANTALYKTARISPISLTYYGFCLENGNYKVKLHFAEIMFTDNNTFESIGRRVFDIYIQGKLVMKDFNIANEAQGVGKEIIQPFDAYVNSSDLEIRFYWAGKGTTNIPYKSVYGPLISAISIEKESRNSIPISAVVGIVLTTIIVVILSIVGILWWRGCLGKKASLAKELKSLNFRTSLFTLRQIKEATNNFDISNKIGEGGFGPVYKGVLSDGTIIAVKQLSSTSKQGNREFINEIAMISALQHPYLVKLYGCCVEEDQLFLVYEYMENNSLAYALFGLKDCSIKLDWPTRYRICVGIARGLCFLHEESRLKIVHRDIKATNVLLDKDLNPKISDFGLAKLDEEDNTHISTRIAGSYGYMAPEYAMHGHLTDKADVYSFGIVALEIVSGKSNTIQQAKDQAFSLLNWAHLLKDKGNLLELVDPRLDSDFNKEEAMVMINTALLCTNVISTKRPTMSSVVSMLEGRIVVPEFILDQNEVMDHQKKLEKMQQYYAQIQKNNISEIEGPSSSIDYHEQWIGSPSSTSDLYPIKLDSSYLEKRN